MQWIYKFSVHALEGIYGSRSVCVSVPKAWISLKTLCSPVMVSFADSKLFDFCPASSSIILWLCISRTLCVVHYDYMVYCVIYPSARALGMVASGHCPCLPCSAHYHKTLYLYAMWPCRNIGISKQSVLIDKLQCTCPIGFAVVDNEDQDRCYCKYE